MVMVQISTHMAVRAVSDILSQGGNRAPSRWPRLIVAAVVLAVLTVAIVHSLPRSLSQSRHAASRPAASAAPPPPVSGTQSGALSGDAAVADEPDGITGQVSTWPDGLRLLTGGDWPTWFSPATGRMTSIGGLPPVRSGYQFTRVAGGWALQASPAAQAGCGGCAGPPRAVYFLADGGRSAAMVGLADAVAPGTAGTLWLTGYPSAAYPGTAAGTALDVSVTGRRLGPPLVLPAGYMIAQGTGSGLLLAPAEPLGTMADELWNPAAPKAARTFEGVIAASADQIAWAPPCAARCRVQVLDLATGRQVLTELPAASSVANAAFSPDGNFLALQVSFGDNDNDGQLAVQLELVSLASGRLTTVPQTWVSSDALIGFGWPASGDSLVAELSFTTKVQLASWQPGASRLAITALSPHQDPSSLVIGQHA
jgi:hypothetical protein